MDKKAFSFFESLKKKIWKEAITIYYTYRIKLWRNFKTASYKKESIKLICLETISQFSHFLLTKIARNIHFIEWKNFQYLRNYRINQSIFYLNALDFYARDSWMDWMHNYNVNLSFVMIFTKRSIGGRRCTNITDYLLKGSDWACFVLQINYQFSLFKVFKFRKIKDEFKL